MKYLLQFTASWLPTAFQSNHCGKNTQIWTWQKTHLHMCIQRFLKFTTYKTKWRSWRLTEKYPLFNMRATGFFLSKIFQYGCLQRERLSHWYADTYTKRTFASLYCNRQNLKFFWAASNSSLRIQRKALWPILSLFSCYFTVDASYAI